MPQRVSGRSKVAPHLRVRDEGPEGDGYFYPGEAISILSLEKVDYRQLRRLFELVRKQAGLEVPPGWARFSLLDLAAMRVALTLTWGDFDPASPPRRLELEPILKACNELRRQGVKNPLLDVQLERHGRKVFALMDGVLLDPVSGQEVLFTTKRLTEGFLEDQPFRDVEVERMIERDAERVGPKPPTVRSRIP